jgi:hypothetical protein
MVLITVKQAADVLGLKSRNSIYRKIESGDLPSVPGGKGSPLIERDGLEDLWRQVTREQGNSPKPMRPVAERVKPAASQQQRRQQPVDDGEVPDYNDERARHEKEKRLLAELARQEKERELLRREDVELAWGGAVNITRTRLLGVPSTAKQRIPHLEVEEVELLTTLIREALDELAAGEVKA